MGQLLKRLMEQKNGGSMVQKYGTKKEYCTMKMDMRLKMHMEINIGGSMVSDIVKMVQLLNVLMEVQNGG
jgi:hypothetical protein